MSIRMNIGTYKSCICGRIMSLSLMYIKSILFVHGSVRENKVTFNFYGFHHKVLNCGSDDDINKVKWIRDVQHVSFFVMWRSY